MSVGALRLGVHVELLQFTAAFRAVLVVERDETQRAPSALNTPLIQIWQIHLTIFSGFMPAFGDLDATVPLVGADYP
jgi:hypothetical protein